MRMVGFVRAIRQFTLIACSTIDTAITTAMFFYYVVVCILCHTNRIVSFVRTFVYSDLTNGFPLLHIVKQAAQGKYLIIVYCDLTVDYFMNDTGDLGLVGLVIAAILDSFLVMVLAQ